MAKPTTVLYDRIFIKIEKSMSQPSNVRKLKQIFSEIISRNSDALSSTIPNKTVFIDKRIERSYYELLNITDQEVLQAIKDSGDIQDHWNTIKTHQYSVLFLLTAYFHQRKNAEMAKICSLICSLYMYKNVRAKHFPRGVSESTEKIMNYTLSRLSMKNDIKKYGSIMNLIAKKNDVFLELWLDKPELKGVITDDTICKMVNDNHRRYDTVMINFHRELAIDTTSGNYMNVDQDIDDGETFIQSDNVSYMVERVTQQVMNKFNLSSVPNYKLADQVIEIGNNSCSKNNLRNMINYLYNGHDKEMERLVRVILQIYLFENKKKVEDIKSWDFINTMLEQYKKLTTNNKNIVEMKEIVNNIFDKTNFGGEKKRPTRQATVNDCKRSIFLFVLMFIMQNLIN